MIDRWWRERLIWFSVIATNHLELSKGIRTTKSHSRCEHALKCLERRDALHVNCPRRYGQIGRLRLKSSCAYPAPIGREQICHFPLLLSEQRVMSPASISGYTLCQLEAPFNEGRMRNLNRNKKKSCSTNTTCRLRQVIGNHC